MDAITPQTIGSIVLADAEPASRALLQAHLARGGWEVLLAETGRQVLDILASRSVDVMVLDIRLPDLHGIDVLEQARTVRPGLPVIVMACLATAELAVEAMRAGAVDCLAKPCDGNMLETRVRRWALPCPGARVVRLGGCIALEPAACAVLRDATRLVPGNLPVAICGAPGAGRKFLATAMYQAAGRAGPLQTLDLALLPAEQARPKLAQAVEAAAAGAVLVADVQQLKPAEQEPLARWLAAGSDTRPRFYVTVSDTPARLVAAGRMAKSLAAALEGAVLSLPPLAARRADIPLLAEQIVSQMMPATPVSLSTLSLEALGQYDWPGNIRQLRLVLERAARMASPGPVEPRHLPILQAVHRDPVPMGWTTVAAVDLAAVVDNVERTLIESAMFRTKQNQAKAAELLGIPRTTLRDKLEKYGFTPRSKVNDTAK